MERFWVTAAMLPNGNDNIRVSWLKFHNDARNMHSGAVELVGRNHNGQFRWFRDLDRKAVLSRDPGYSFGLVILDSQNITAFKATQRSGRRPQNPPAR
jgi:hypothetical protein